jgi:hypothetical protein
LSSHSAAVPVAVLAVFAMLGLAALRANQAPTTTAPVQTATEQAAPTTSPSGAGSTAAGTSGTSPPVIPAAFAGTWAGQVSQPAVSRGSFPITLTLTAGSPTARLTLPTLDCAATLTVSEPGSSGGELHLLEHVTSDPHQRCAEAARIALTLKETHTIAFFWQDVTAANNSATAILTLAPVQQ